MKIANKINLSFSIVVVILVGISLVTFYAIAKTNLEKAIYAHLSTTAQSRAHHIEEHLEEDKHRMKIMAESNLIETALKASIRNDANSKELINKMKLQLNEYLETEKDVYEMFIINSDGQIVLSTDESNIGLDKSKDLYFLGAKTATYIKDAYYSQTTKKKGIAISVPITDDETKKLLGVFVARFELAGLNKITTERTGLGETGELYIVNKHGYMITPSRFNKDTFLKQKVDTANFRNCSMHKDEKHVLSQGKIVSVFPDYRGVRALGTHGYIPEMQWSLLAEIDEKEALAPLAMIKLIFIIILCAVPVTVWTVGMLVSRAITAPIHKLHRGTEIIAEGDLDYKVGTDAKDEIGQLSRAFDEMTYKLKDYHANLEKKVQGRTAELRDEVSQRTSAKKVLEQRIKEINCLYGLSKLIERPQISLEQILEETTELIRSTYQHPDITCVRITFEGMQYKTDNFEKTELSQYTTIKIRGNKAGTIEVYYLEEKAESDGGPFLREERDLLDAVAEHLSRIAERKQTGEKLELFRNLTDRSNDCIFVIEPKWGRFLDVNDRACASLGYTREELLDMTLKDIDESIPDDSLWQERIKELKLKTDLVIQGRHKRKDGTTFFVEASLKLLSQKKQDYIIAVARDITERKQAEEATRLAYKKLEQANIELKEMQSQMVQSEKLASIGQLAAGVAHEMNTPVGFVASNFQTLESYVKKFRDLLEMHDELIGKIKTSEKKELLNKVDDISQARDVMEMDFILEDIQGLFDDSRESLDRVTNIIQNLRDFSRIDQPGSFDKYNLNDGIGATLVVAKNEIKYDAELKTDLSELPPILCNAGQINQVFLNILINAAQAVKSQERENQGTITIRTYATDDQVVCEISDDGCGIAPENLPKVFDPFFTTKSVGKGTGLGLSVSYDIIVNKHNGEILVDSTVGEGSKFTIKLPIKRKNPDYEEATENSEKKNSVICGR